MEFKETQDYKKIYKETMKVCEKHKCTNCRLNGKAQLNIGSKQETCLFLIYGEVLRLITDTLETEKNNGTNKLI